MNHAIHNDGKEPGSMSFRKLTEGRGSRTMLTWTCIVAMCIIAILFVAWRPGPRPSPLPPAPPVVELQPTVDRAKFFESDVQPAIAAAIKANHEAADRCIRRLDEMFAKQREGVKPFVEDLTTWGTRFRVMCRMPSDWWYKRKTADEFIKAKFEEHLFSQASLEDGIQSALGEFRKDIEANNNQLLTSVNAAVSRSNLPNTPKVEIGEFAKSVADSLQRFTLDSAKDSITNLVITEIASNVGAAAATKLTVEIAARVAAAVAATAATEGGATAGGAARGGGGGSAGGPIGTAVGFGVGLVVGVAVDWWMSSRFKGKLTNQLNSMIDETEKSVIDGRDGQPAASRASLDKACEAWAVRTKNRFMTESLKEDRNEVLQLSSHGNDHAYPHGMD